MSKTIEINEDFFQHLLNCLANQKFIGEIPPNGDAVAMGKEDYDEQHSEGQKIIDSAWSDGMAILYGKPFIPQSKVLQKSLMFGSKHIRPT